jgi:hypothetical protein
VPSAHGTLLPVAEPDLFYFPSMALMRSEKIQPPGTASREAGMQQWRVGEVTISKICELEQIQDLSWLIKQASREALAEIP